MDNQTKKPKQLIDVSSTKRCLWITLEATEVMELKRVEMDRDTDAAISYFWEVINPRVRKAAAERNVAVDSL